MEAYGLQAYGNEALELNRVALEYVPKKEDKISTGGFGCWCDENPNAVF
jgi:hypothetical protein